MSKKIAVTGGSGKLGGACIDALLGEGWTPFNFDLAPPRERKCSFTRLDLTEYGQVVEALAGIDALHDGVDAVLHLAAISGPSHAGNAKTFVSNIAATFHVFQAAKLLKIHNVVWASSEALLGYPFKRPPAYVPLDEDVPKTPEVAYALAKDLEEEMAVQFCRWDPEQKMIGLRFSNVMDPADYAEFPSFESDPASRKVEPVVVHRRPRWRAGGGEGARL
jgi:nucleoside-diphosphate-sugar epimerase